MTLEEMIVDAQRTIDVAIACQHRALDAKYNLLRVSERRWSVIRISSTATIYYGATDVVTFEQVTGPLRLIDAIKELVRSRSSR